MGAKAPFKVAIVIFVHRINWLSANFCDNLMRLFDTHVTSVNDLQEEVIII